MASRCGIDDQRGDLLSELTAGFEALLDKVEVLASRNAQFEQQILNYQAEGRQQYTPTRASSTSWDVETGKGLKSEPQWYDEQRIEKGIQAWKLLRTSMTGTVPLRRKGASKLSPHATTAGDKVEVLEYDFTTLGTEGSLKCPFSDPVARKMSQPVENASQLLEPHPSLTPSMDQDRTASGSHYDDTASKSPSNRDSVPKCPIRYLNQLPPEDVAEYFENHKHEIPRSHEVCVKRYQANEQSIRSLDAKYGSLVNMIQGLGAKHQPMLPSQEGSVADDEAVEMDKKSIEKVEKWAKGCGDDAIPLDEGLGTVGNSESDRTGHFERPLKEVRLGESPSRPWGIQVPYIENPAVCTDFPDNQSFPVPAKAASLKDGPVVSTPRPAGKCPFGHGAAKASPVAKSIDSSSPIFNEPIRVDMPQNIPGIAQDSKTTAPETANVRPQMVFRGPVFFGYSAEDAAVLMRSFQQTTQ